MAEAKIDLEINGSGAATTLGELKSNAEALNTALEGATIGSAEYKKLNQELVTTNKQVKNLELGFEALDSENVASEIGSVAGAIGDVATGLVLVSGGNKSLEEMAHRIETALGVSMALKGAIEGAQSARKLYNDALARGNALSKVAIVLQKAFNKAMNANIILAVGAALIVVAAALSKFFKGASAAEQIQEELNAAMDAGADAVGKEEAKLKLLTVALLSAEKGTQARTDALKGLNDVIPDSIGFITEETLATGAAIKVINEYIKVVKQRAELTALENILSEKIAERLKLQLDLAQEQDEFERAKIMVQISNLEKLENATLQMANAGQKNLNNLEKTNEVMVRGQEVRKEDTRLIKENTDAVKENGESRFAKQIRINERIKKGEQALADFKAELAIKEAEDAQELADRKLAAQDQLDLLLRDKNATEFELKLNRLQDQHEAEMELLSELIPEENALRLELESQYQDERTKLVEENEAQRKQARIDAANQTIETAKSVLSAAESLNTIFHGRELERIKQKQKAGEKLSKAEEQRLRKEEAIQKAFALAKIAIDTATAISGIIAASTAGDPYTYAARVAAGIASILAGIASAYKALGGGNQPSGVSPNVSDAAEEQESSSNAPVINEFETGSSLLNAPQQVVVVEDINNGQNSVAAIEATATYG